MPKIRNGLQCIAVNDATEQNCNQRTGSMGINSTVQRFQKLSGCWLAGPMISCCTTIIEVRNEEQCLEIIP